MSEYLLYQDAKRKTRTSSVENMFLDFFENAFLLRLSKNSLKG